MNETILKVQHLGKSFGTHEILKDIDFSVKPKDVTCIIGPSGSGKSTLLNMLGGLDRLNEGHIFIEGKDITALSRKELGEYRRLQLGFVFQSYNLIPELTVHENVQVVADIAEHPLEIDPLLEKLGMKEHADHFPSELSGGQQQRCAIARALVKNPGFLLCDELTGALDSVSSREVLSVLETVNKVYGTTIIMITHNERIAAMADRVIRIHDGRITENRRQDKKRVKELKI